MRGGLFRFVYKHEIWHRCSLGHTEYIFWGRHSRRSQGRPYWQNPRWPPVDIWFCHNFITKSHRCWVKLLYMGSWTRRIHVWTQIPSFQLGTGRMAGWRVVSVQRLYVHVCSLYTARDVRARSAIDSWFVRAAYVVGSCCWGTQLKAGPRADAPTSFNRAMIRRTRYAVASFLSVRLSVCL